MPVEIFFLSLSCLIRQYKMVGFVLFGSFNVKVIDGINYGSGDGLGDGFAWFYFIALYGYHQYKKNKAQCSWAFSRKISKE